MLRLKLRPPAASSVQIPGGGFLLVDVAASSLRIHERGFLLVDSAVFFSTDSQAWFLTVEGPCGDVP
jgi:hypothetical protein